MLWNDYVFSSGDAIHDLWDGIYSRRSAKLLYITGKGFDSRGCEVLATFLDNVQACKCKLEEAELLLVDFSGYELDEELLELTGSNVEKLRSMFSPYGVITEVRIGTSSHGEDDLSSASALRQGSRTVIEKIGAQTDVILDISSLPRIVYLSLMAAILSKIVGDFKNKSALSAGGINFQILVAEDPVLDSKIQSRDPSNEIVYIPGFSPALDAASHEKWPLVWLPLLGENRTAQFIKIKEAIIGSGSEICPILPHPSKNPRRADQLLFEYNEALFSEDANQTSNILYAHESNPFEAYRQIFKAIERYKSSLTLLGGCKLAVTPLASKLITIGAGLACLEANKVSTEDYIVAMPYSEPTRYTAPSAGADYASPVISSLLLTGEAYQDGSESS